ncbi:SipW-dependent-type signal peptide-containing protein [Bacillus sp. RG28]|uniref:SipW-dependent-type signal peptide-containing protein n=1 Tax=Gottfriedia endophytica TaxID=2820819 RepID=A0A940NUJ6_9BACI|nr:TasA family protein [Gottfriedia endophytica]MBP0725113.1 SipW-dependent-type signal peptide-containing protein [Gottfriedia endophytica]
MSIKKKIALAMGGTALAASMVAGGTFALFTSQVSNTGNTFAAGNVSIQDTTGGKVYNVNGTTGFLVPGDNGTSYLKVKNNGNVASWVHLASVENKNGGLFAGSKPVTLDIHDGNAQLLAPGEEKSFAVNYNFDINADNSYENATGTFDIKVQAVQAKNNTKTDNSGPSSWGN